MSSWSRNVAGTADATGRHIKVNKQKQNVTRRHNVVFPRGINLIPGNVDCGDDAEQPGDGLSGAARGTSKVTAIDGDGFKCQGSDTATRAYMSDRTDDVRSYGEVHPGA